MPWSSCCFNPRPRAGAMLRISPTSSGACLFQSAPPCGGDELPAAALRIERVSIRAPVRGRCGLQQCGHAGTHSFNPRPRAGAMRLYRFNNDTNSLCFNPRPRAGAMTRGALRIAVADRFNPRPRAGAMTGWQWACVVSTDRFNPRPRAGAMPAGRPRPQRPPVSIRAPVRGRCFRVPLHVVPAVVSIRAPVRGRWMAC